MFRYFLENNNPKLTSRAKRVSSSWFKQVSNLCQVLSLPWSLPHVSRHDVPHLEHRRINVGLRKGRRYSTGRLSNSGCNHLYVGGLQCTRFRKILVLGRFFALHNTWIHSSDVLSFENSGRWVSSLADCTKLFFAHWWCTFWFSWHFNQLHCDDEWWIGRGWQMICDWWSRGCSLQVVPSKWILIKSRRRWGTDRWFFEPRVLCGGWYSQRLLNETGAPSNHISSQQGSAGLVEDEKERDRMGRKEMEKDAVWLLHGNIDVSSFRSNCEAQFYLTYIKANLSNLSMSSYLLASVIAILAS